mmetsp:Transcript_13590/g.17912  ORF Transcript_13590/g.17912 Transcript_13590/m.17912 type:complete len:316 (+) Transcript_13590:268-1215(+)
MKFLSDSYFYLVLLFTLLFFSKLFYVESLLTPSNFGANKFRSQNSQTRMKMIESRDFPYVSGLCNDQSDRNKLLEYSRWDWPSEMQRPKLEKSQFEILKETQKQLEKIPNLKEIADKTGFILDNFCLFRYLKAKNFSPQQASECIQKTLQWRLATFGSGFDLPELEKEISSGKMYVEGRDLDGRPIIHVHLGKGQFTSSLAMQLLVYNLENAVASMDVIGEISVIINCFNFDKKNLPGVQVLKEGIKTLAAHYPNRLGRLFVTNVDNSVPWLLWKGLSWTLKPSTKQKVQLLSSTESKVLEQYINPEHLAQHRLI